jgi:hypothetical protein
MIGWLIFGLVIYYSYSIRHSKVQKAEAAQSAE